jgi:hypothetical protein
MKRYRRRPWLNPKVEIRPSQIHGKGMFANDLIVRGEIVAIWGGNFVTVREAENAKLPGVLVQQIDDDVFEVFC